MDTKKTVIIGVVAVLLIGFAVWVSGLSGPTGPMGPKGDNGTTVGAMGSPDINTPYLHWGAGNGSYLWPTSNQMTIGTTTPCNIQSPAATSTLVRSSVQFTTGSSTAMAVTIAKALTPNATTTALAQAALAANVPLTMMATSTNDNWVFGPNQWLVVGLAGGSGAANNVPVGLCNATWESLL